MSIGTNLTPIAIVNNLKRLDTEKLSTSLGSTQADKLLITDSTGIIVTQEQPISRDYYGTCSTAASTQKKLVTCSDTNFKLVAGTHIRVLFTNGQTYNGAPSLNVNSTGDITIQYKQGTSAIRYIWIAGEIIDFTYNGTNWVMHRSGLATTSYYGLAKLATSATSTSTSLALTPASLNSFSLNMISNSPTYSASNTYNIGDRVRYNYNTYECITGISTPESWNVEHWKKLDDIQTQIDDVNTAISGFIPTSQIGIANGIAELDANGLIPSSRLPSYVDDVLEYTSMSSFPTTGETGKIYVDTTANLTYRWSGSGYIQISPSLALGTTSATAFRGDYGETAYTHAIDNNRLTTAKSTGLYKISTTAQGHIASATAVTKTDITDLGIPAQDTTYSSASTSSDGLMTSGMVTKLNGITESADSVSFTRSLTSGTKIGSITINGTSTDIYCQTNTDAMVTQTYTSSNANYSLLFKTDSGITSTSNVTTTSRYGNKLYVNPSTGAMYASSFTANDGTINLTSGAYITYNTADGIVFYIGGTKIAQISSTGVMKINGIDQLSNT